MYCLICIACVYARVSVVNISRVDRRCSPGARNVCPVKNV